MYITGYFYINVLVTLLNKCNLVPEDKTVNEFYLYIKLTDNISAGHRIIFIPHWTCITSGWHIFVWGELGRWETSSLKCINIDLYMG